MKLLTLHYYMTTALTDKSFINIWHDINIRLNKTFGLNQCFLYRNHHFNVTFHSGRRSKIHAPPSMVSTIPIIEINMKNVNNTEACYK